MPPNHRLFRHGAAGPVYRVYLAPCELPGGRGIDPEADAVVFEEILHGRVFCARLYRGWSLDELSEWDLEELLEAAGGVQHD